MTNDATLTVSAAIDGFCADLALQRGRRGRKSAKTVRTYASALRSFAQSLRTAGADPEADSASALVCAHVVDFARSIAQAGFSPATTNVYLTAAVKFYTWLHRRGLAGFSATDLALLKDELQEDWRSSEQAHALRLPEEEDVQAALACAHDAQGDAQTTQRLRLLALRNAAVLETLRATCARIGEIAQLARKDCDLDAQTAQVLGKGRKPRTVYLDERATSALAAYLAARDAAQLAHVSADEPLFARHDRPAGNRLLPVSSDALRSGLYRICERAGVADIRPHSLRHRGATLLQRATHDLAIVQKVLGHESAATTAAIYLHLDDADVRAAMDKVQR